jgi:hypothetical protein
MYILLFDCLLLLLFLFLSALTLTSSFDRHHKAVFLYLAFYAAFVPIIVIQPGDTFRGMEYIIFYGTVIGMLGLLSIAPKEEQALHRERIVGCLAFTFILGLVYLGMMYAYMRGYPEETKIIQEKEGGLTFMIIEWILLVIIECISYVILEQQLPPEVVKEAPVPDTMSGTDECSICFTENIRLHCLVPCGHTTCNSCGKKMKKCPHCKKRVREVIPIYEV